MLHAVDYAVAMERQNHDSGTPWERKVGYSRAVRVGNLVFTAGTMAADAGGVITSPGDPYWQTKYICDKIERSLQAVGASLEDVVRTRIYITNIDHQERVGTAHREVFERIRPCCTMIEVSRLAAPEAVVEIEVEAVVA